MFILLMAMAGIGLLIKYVLLPGVQRNLKYGNDIDLEYLGMDRHQWGSIHLIISITFLILIIIHILLHWKIVLCIFRRMMPGRTWQVVVTGSIAFISLLLISFSLLVRPEHVPHKTLYHGRESLSVGRHMGREHQTLPVQVTDENTENPVMDEPYLVDRETVTEENQYVAESPEHQETAGYPEHRHETEIHEHHEAYDEYEVSGNHTLQYVANRYDVSAAVICRDLKIPEHLAGERLGRLKKMYPFTMTDVRKSIYIYKRQNKQ
jgi:hypothetical protein